MVLLLRLLLMLMLLLRRRLLRRWQMILLLRALYLKGNIDFRARKEPVRRRPDAGRITVGAQRLGKH